MSVQLMLSQKTFKGKTANLNIHPAKSRKLRFQPYLEMVYK